MASTITERLEILVSATSDIALAINEMGGSAPSKLAEYGSAIRALPVGTTDSPVRYNATIKSWPECIRTFTAPSHCESIGSSAFLSAVTLASVDLSRVTNIAGRDAFASCSNLATAGGAYLLTMTGSYAFAYCSKLTSLSFPTCTDIGQYAFYQCGSSVWSSPSYVTSGLSVASFPACITIGSSAFQRCYNLKTLLFPMATTICQAAFSGCATLPSVSMSRVTAIGSYAFQGCIKLASVSFPACEIIWSEAFSGCASSESGTLYGLKSATFPNCLEVGSNAFAYCSYLSRISFPKCQKIWSSAFRNCSSLALVDFTGVSAVPELTSSNAFYSASSAKIKVPSSLYTAWIAATNWSLIASQISTTG